MTYPSRPKPVMCCLNLLGRPPPPSGFCKLTASPMLEVDNYEIGGESVISTKVGLQRGG